MNQDSDIQLIEAVRAGGDRKNKAFTELYNRYSSRVYLYCRKIIGEGRYADDIFQETFLRLIRSVEKGAAIDNVLGYLLKICRNLIQNYRRDNPAVFVEIEDFHVPTFTDPYESVEMAKMIDQALNLLIEEHKEAFVLQAFGGLTFKEIGELTGVPVSTVRNRVVRAKRKLKEILRPYLEYSGKSENGK